MTSPSGCRTNNLVENPVDGNAAFTNQFVEGAK